MTIEEQFNATRNKYKNQVAGNNTFGNGGRSFKGDNELDICGPKGLGTIMGVYVNDKNNVPYRLIDGYRSLRINKEIAEEYGIKNYELRVCDSRQYNCSDEDKQLLDKIIQKIDFIRDNWDAWDGKICKYPPQYYGVYTIQYMKVLQKLDQNQTPVQIDPGVKVIKSRSKAYIQQFDSLSNGMIAGYGGLSFLSDFLGRNVGNRQNKYIISTKRPQIKYEFSISSIQAPVPITQEDLDKAGDLDTEVIDVTKVNRELLEKWNSMLTSEYQKIKGVANQGAIPAHEVITPESAPDPTPAVAHTPVNEVHSEPVSEPDDNPFA